MSTATKKLLLLTKYTLLGVLKWWLL